MNTTGKSNFNSFPRRMDMPHGWICTRICTWIKVKKRLGCWWTRQMSEFMYHWCVVVILLQVGRSWFLVLRSNGDLIPGNDRIHWGKIVHSSRNDSSGRIKKISYVKEVKIGNSFNYESDKLSVKVVPRTLNYFDCFIPSALHSSPVQATPNFSTLSTRDFGWVGDRSWITEFQKVQNGTQWMYRGRSLTHGWRKEIHGESPTISLLFFECFHEATCPFGTRTEVHYSRSSKQIFFHRSWYMRQRGHNGKFPI